MSTQHRSKKRAGDHIDTPFEGTSTDVAGDAHSTTNFRNVSACNRCRTRKNRCDQKLPRCTNCEKANVKCIGFDPVSRRAIPRSYVHYLEKRVRSLEALLDENGIPYPPPAEHFAIDENSPGLNVSFPGLEGEDGKVYDDAAQSLDPILQAGEASKLDDAEPKMTVTVPVKPETGEPRIAFSQIVSAAVRSSVAKTPSDRSTAKSSKNGSDKAAAGDDGSVKDSFFGLITKTSVAPAPFPDHTMAVKLVELFFEYANPQIPILHREDFQALVQKVYATDPDQRSPRQLYFLNIVFAIGSGIILDPERGQKSETSSGPPAHKRQKLDGERHYEPEQYHASAIAHLERFSTSTPISSHGRGGLEELQAILLLASLALLRPVAPGLWYIVGVAMRLATDIGLHVEEVDKRLEQRASASNPKSSKKYGRKLWIRDYRRRLWWCTYAFDRLVSTCVGRPFGISDQVITTEFPSVLDDKYITEEGFAQSPEEVAAPSYKLSAQHYFRLRLLQSEMLAVLQYRQAERFRSLGANQSNDYIHKDLLSPFLSKFDSFQEWRFDMDRRLQLWKESIPKHADIGVSFTPLFLELNYYQAIVMLYRQSLAVPDQLANEFGGATDKTVYSPEGIERATEEDEQYVFMKVAQAGHTMLRIYRQLHRLKLVNYTFLATHHLFVCGKVS
jgi:hypothetical protein